MSETRQERNPFPRPSALELAYLKELVRCAKHCYAHGWSHGRAGNVSLRGRDGLFWQSPANTAKDEIPVDLFVPILLETCAVGTPCAAKPSNETAIHAGIYRAVPAARAVVHSHPPHLVALSRGGADLVFQGEEMQKHLGCRDHNETVRIPVVANPAPREMAGMADQVAQVIRPGVDILVLAGHGAYAWAKTPSEALSLLETLEFLCKTRCLG